MEIDARSGSKIIVITGGFSVGKTSLCRRLVNEYKLAGKSVVGLLSPARFEDGKKTGIETLDIASGQSRLLASSTVGELHGLDFGIWTFDTQVITWANTCLKKITSTDVIMIDEIGPLEFNEGKGWQAVFDVIKLSKFQQAIIVIRPGFLERFKQMGFLFSTFWIKNGCTEDDLIQDFFLGEEKE